MLSRPSNKGRAAKFAVRSTQNTTRIRFRAELAFSRSGSYGGPREGGSKTAVAVINARVAAGSDTSACTSGAGSDNALGKTAADAEPEQNAQCDEPCLGAYG